MATLGLTDPVPGTIGFEGGDGTLVLLRFDDDLDHLYPTDAAGGLEDLAAPGGVSMPPATEAFTGRGRDFGGNPAFEGLEASDKADADTITTRDATVRALVTVDVSATPWPRAVYARGNNDGTAAQRYSLGLELDDVDAGPAHLELRMFWQDSAGVLQTQTGGTFETPAAGQFVMLTATRRWVSPTEVVCRYYVNDRLLAEVTSVDGDIAGATTGKTTIGMRGSGGTYVDFFDGVMDELEVLDYEISAEEVAATWQRLAVHQPNGVAMVTAMAPPGSRWGLDRSKATSKLPRIAGTGLGYAWAKADELRQNWLPARAYREWLVTWEELLGIPPPRPNDSLDARRARAAAFLARDNGNSSPAIRAALAELFDQDADDVELLRFSNWWTDTFATLAPERWHADAPWAVAAGALSATVAGGTDARWDSSSHAPKRCITPLSSGEGELVVVAKITASSITSDSMAGLHLFNWRTGNGLWVGEGFSGSTRFGYASYINGVSTGFVQLGATVAGLPAWYRIIRDSDDPDTYRLGHSVTGPTSGFTEFTVSNLMTDPEWAGVAVLGFDAAVAAGVTLTVDDITIGDPMGTRNRYWYAYRDLGLPGSPDMIGADLLVDAWKRAHTYAAACSSKSVLCDDPIDGACDGGPMGAL